MIEALFQRALRLHREGKLADAAGLYDDVIRQDPRHFRALYLRGFLHSQAEEYAAAERLIGRAIALNPAVPDTFYNRGCALQNLHRNEEAVACFDRAVALKPDYAEAFFNRGTSQLHLRASGAALASFDAALALGPGDAEAWYNRGVALQGLRRFAEAGASFEKALALAPDLAFAKGKLLYARLQCCDWRFYDADKRAIAADIHAGKRAVAPLEFLLISSSPEEQYRAARVWMQKQHPDLVAGKRLAPYAHERIRVAYISADFRDHAVAHQIAGVIERHDRVRFEIYALSHGQNDGRAMRTRLEGAFDRFLDARNLSDADAAQTLKQWEADIAVDLTGYTQDGRAGILARRAAPVQVSFLGYPGTMAAEFVDYLIADAIVLPEEHRPFFTEKIAYLPETFMPTDSRRPFGAAASRRDAGLPEHGFVFSSFNNVAKLSPELFARWMRVVSAIESSVLWLSEPGAEAVENLRREARSRGVAPERLVFAPYAPSAEAHLGRLRLADLFLDTLPYNAHSTAADALWANVPVLTVLGESFAGRVAASLLHAAGLPELTVRSFDEYESLAVRLARAPEMLAALKAKLASNRASHPLFDTARFCRHLEAAYAAMVERHRRGEPPAHFCVTQL